MYFVHLDRLIIINYQSSGRSLVREIDGQREPTPGKVKKDIWMAGIAHYLLCTYP